jgi:hypothetical protein
MTCTVLWVGVYVERISSATSNGKVSSETVLGVIGLDVTRPKPQRGAQLRELMNIRAGRRCAYRSGSHLRARRVEETRGYGQNLVASWDHDVDSTVYRRPLGLGGGHAAQG